MAIVIAIGATHRIAIGDNGASIGATYCRHWLRAESAANWWKSSLEECPLTKTYLSPLLLAEELPRRTTLRRGFILIGSGLGLGLELGFRLGLWLRLGLG